MTKGKVLSQSPAARVLAGPGRVGVLGYSGEVGRVDADASGEQGEGGSWDTRWRHLATRSRGRRGQEVNSKQKPMVSPSFYSCVNRILGCPQPAVAAALSLTQEHLPSESWRPSMAFPGAEKKVKTPPPSPKEPTHWSKDQQLPGMLREGPTSPHSQNYTLQTPALTSTRELPFRPLESPKRTKRAGSYSIPEIPRFPTLESSALEWAGEREQDRAGGGSSWDREGAEQRTPPGRGYPSCSEPRPLLPSTSIGCRPSGPL